MSVKNKYSISDLRVMFLAGCLFIFLLTAFFWLPELNKARSERNAAMNLYADSWCQRQGYTKVLPYVDPQYLNKTCYYGKVNGTWVANDNTDSDIPYDFVTTVMMIAVDNESFNAPEIQGIALRVADCPNATKFQYYDTGRFLPSEQVIECLGEQVDSSHLKCSFEQEKLLCNGVGASVDNIYQKSQKFDAPKI